MGRMNEGSTSKNTQNAKENAHFLIQKKKTTKKEKEKKMSKQETMIEVGVFDNSTSWGTIGTYKTERGAIREGRKFARAHSTQHGYAGYGPTIRLCEVDAATGEAVSPTWDVRAW
jgi:hypothetical protein